MSTNMTKTYYSYSHIHVAASGIYTAIFAKSVLSKLHCHWKCRGVEVVFQLSTVQTSHLQLHCVKHARIRFFFDGIYGFSYTGIYGLEKTHILGYFTQCCLLLDNEYLEKLLCRRRFVSYF